jgi:hypothetical protein
MSMYVSVNKSSTGHYEVAWDQAGYGSNATGKTFILAIRHLPEPEASSGTAAAAADDGPEWTAIVTGLTSKLIRVNPDCVDSPGGNTLQLNVVVLECNSRQLLFVGHNKGECYTIDRRGTGGSMHSPYRYSMEDQGMHDLIARLTISSASPVYGGSKS